MFLSSPILLIMLLLSFGSGQEVENQMIIALSVHPRKVGSRPEVENRMIFDSSAQPLRY